MIDNFINTSIAISEKIFVRNILVKKCNYLQTPEKNVKTV